MLQTPYLICTHCCLHEIACNFHASVFFLFNWRTITILWCFCHTSARIGHRYTCVPSLLNPAQASDDLPPPLPPPPQGQASLARGPVLQRALMRPRPGVCSVSFPCPSLQLGKTTLIFSSFFSFFFFRKCFAKRSLMFARSCLWQGIQKLPTQRGQEGVYFCWIWPTYGTVFLHFFFFSHDHSPKEN